MTQRLRKDGEVPAVAFRIRLCDGYTHDDPLALAERSLILEPVPHPDFELVMEQSGATRLGPYTWTFGVDAYPQLTPLKRAIQVLKPGQIAPAAKLLTGAGNPTNVREGYRVWVDQRDWLVGAATPEVRMRMQDLTTSMGRNTMYTIGRSYDDSHGFVSVSTNGRSYYLTVVTMAADQPVEDAIENGLFDERLKVRVNLRQPGKSNLEPKPAHPAAVFQTSTLLAKHGATVIIDTEIAALKERFDKALVAYPAPGRPAEVSVSIGPLALDPALYQKVDGMLDDKLAGYGGQSGRYGVRSISRVEEVFEVLQSQAPSLDIVMHPKTEDLYRLVRAEPVEDSRLREYQKLAVGMHLATKYGYTNALEPGLGKTICALCAMRLRSQQVERYRGLIVVEANVRAQWAGEAKIWFPEANLITVYGNENLEELGEALQSDDPVVVIASYAMAGRVAKLVKPDEVAASDNAGEDLFVVASSDEETDDEPAVDLGPIDPERGEQGSLFTAGGEPNPELDVDAAAVEEPVVAGEPSIEALLDETHWHDLIADEAAVLRNPGTSQAKALWKLRSHAEIAVALTGTPINRNGVDDLGRLIAWTRNDSHMFSGAKLSDQFDVSKDEDLAAFNDAVGPLVLRRNKSDIAEELPEMRAEVVEIRPTADELELARAARDELKRVYEELLALTEMIETSNPADPRVKELEAALVAARGAHLGGTQLARMAASDPASLIDSESAGVELLRGNGLIEAATANKGTKRKWAIEACVERVKEGKQVIVFTEFATVARGLIADLEEAGITVGGILGGGGKQRDRNIEDFRNGDISVLVATSAGKRGLNLQTATTVIHYDLPWTPDDVAQRTARVERIGATADEVEVLFPIAKGTIEERIVALLALRAATAVRALDVARGADGSTTDMGRILASILPAVDTSQLDPGQMTLLDITRVLVEA